MVIRSVTRGVAVYLQDLADDGDGNAFAIPASFKDHTIYVIAGEGVTDGDIVIETAEHADDPDELWAPLGGSPITVTEEGTEVYNFTGIYGAIRARIDGSVTGGLVTVKYIGG